MDKQLQRLAAQRQLYTTAKKVFAAQAVVSGPVAVATAFGVIIDPASKGYVALWGISCANTRSLRLRCLVPSLE